MSEIASTIIGIIIMVTTKSVTYDVVLGKSCCQSKHTAVHVLPRQKMPPQVLPRQQMPKATFSQPYMCMKKTN